MAVISSFQIPPLTFNQHFFSVVELTKKSVAHWEEDSETFLKYIVCTLDGRQRKPDEIASDGSEIHHLASATGFDPTAPQKYSNYRDTVIRLEPDNEKIVVIHSSPRKKRWYDNKAKDSWKT